MFCLGIVTWESVQAGALVTKQTNNAKMSKWRGP